MSFVVLGSGQVNQLFWREKISKIKAFFSLAAPFWGPKWRLEVNSGAPTIKFQQKHSADEPQMFTLCAQTELTGIVE